MRAPCLEVKLRLDPDTVEVFRVKYPRLMSTYIRRCLSAAVQDKGVFDTIFLGFKDASPFRLDKKYKIKVKADGLS